MIQAIKQSVTRNLELEGAFLAGSVLRLQRLHRGERDGEAAVHASQSVKRGLERFHSYGIPALKGHGFQPCRYSALKARL